MTYEYEKVLTPSTGLRLHLNENTAGCSPKVIEALRALTRTDVGFYPDYDAVISACARRLGVAPEQLVLTNGLDEGILAITVEALRVRGTIVPDAIVVVPAFDMYASTAAAAGARVVEVPLGPDFTFPADRILAAIGPDTRLLFLTSPNNPTGLSIPKADIVRIARAAPHVRVLVDEAYADFANTTLIGDPDVGALPNVFIGRTFAKAYGLAGVRAGAIVGQAQALVPLRHIVPPFSLNICATVALTAGLADLAYYEWYLEQARTSKTMLYSALDKAGVRYWPSDANFVLAAFGDRAGAVVQGAGGARHTRPRQVARPRVPGMPSHHDRRGRAHTGVHSRARGGSVRRGVIERQTTETSISIRLALDGRGRYDVRTGIRFLDHMLELFTRHGGFDLRIRAEGDLDVDQHHTVEDIGIALGEAVEAALGSRRGINRAGYFVMPMDESIGVVAIDLGGRAHAVVDARVKTQKVGDLQADLLTDFFEGFARGARANVHLKVLYGRSDHHKVEALFKAFGRALRMACSRDRRLSKVMPSTKGLL